MNVTLVKTFQFEAAHSSQHNRGEAGEPHGHSYRLDVMVRGEIDDKLGWLIDYGAIRRIMAPLYDQLDHHMLNDVQGMQDVSLTGIRQWTMDRLKGELPGLHDVVVSIVGDRHFAPKSVTRNGYSKSGEVLSMTFEAAHFLPALPEEHKCRRMHGHSFHVEVATADAKTAEEPLREIHALLDHRCLNRIQGLENPTSEHLCRWIWDCMSPKITGLEEVVVAETCTARCIYHGP